VTDRIDTLQAIADDGSLHNPSKDYVSYISHGLLVKPGTILPNGAIVMLAKAANQRSGECGIGIVLAYDGHTASPYRTWAYGIDEGLDTTVWGHYFRDEEAAVLDYIRRG